MNQQVSEADQNEINQIQGLKKELDDLKKQQNEILTLLKDKK